MVQQGEAGHRAAGPGQQGTDRLPSQQTDGLQQLHPETTLLLAELLGNLSAVRMPYNIQNLIGNWLQLIGQILLVFNAQQQLWENGPGACYSRQPQPLPQSHTDRGASETAEALAALGAQLNQLQQRLASLEAKQGP